MIQYLYQVTICWGLFYLLYAVLLRKETFFATNRWYLLGTLALGLIIPIIEFQIPLKAVTPEQFHPANYLETITVTAKAIENNLEEIVITPVNESWNIQFTLLTIYWLGVLFFAGRFLFGIGQILRLRFYGKAIRKAGYTLIKTNQVHLPFSFMDYLFWSDKVDFAPEDTERVLRHELCHIKDMHSIDVLLTEILSIFLWCSPFVFLYKNELKNIHEYLADRAVLQDTPTRTYGQLLLKQSQSGLQIAQANNFIHSQLKKRILMMTKTKSQRTALLKYAAILPILFLLVFSISARNNLVELHNTNSLSEASSTDTIPPTANLVGGEDDVFKVVEEMPRFPGCEDKAGNERKDCATKNMLMHIYTNIKYPKEARKAGIQGTSVAKFIVEKDGSISNIKIERSLSEEIDAEVSRVVNTMPNFIPGKQRGKTVRVQFLLPVKFKLEGDAPTEKEKKVNSSDKVILESLPHKPLYIVDGQEVQTIENINVDDIVSIDVFKGEKAIEKYGDKGKDGVVSVITTQDKINVVGHAPKKEEVKPHSHNKHEGEDIFTVVEQMPIYPGASETKEGNKKMLQFIYENLSYPSEAKEAGIEGVVVVNFIITKEGRLIKPQLLRTIGGGTNEEVLRVVNLMSEIPENWTPGYQRGKAVNVSFNLPVKFKLTDDTSTDQKPAIADNNVQTEKDAPFESVNIYPNPTSSTINAEVMVKNNLPTTVMITDINGKQIYKQKFETNHIQIADLDLKDAANGILLLSFLQEGKVVLTKEVSVQR